MLGAPALSEAGLRAAARVAAATGSRLVAETFPARVERGGGLPNPLRLPYPPEQARAALDGAGALVLAGARNPVTFFGYPDQPSSTVPATAVVSVLGAAPQDKAEDVVGALERLAERLRAPARLDSPTVPAPLRPSGSLTPETLVAAIAACQPEGAIVVDESVSSGFGYFPLAAGSARHTYLCHVGGALGQGLPLAMLAFQADGSAMYTLQALWTHARESLDVTTVICANHSYRILQIELAAIVDHRAGAAAQGLLDLCHPQLDWVSLAKGMGLPARRVSTADALLEALDWALADAGPHMVEAIL
jgi:acetolactate synthase-1/2/3 large subunit